MAILRRREINLDEEHRLLTGIIVATQFCQAVLPMIEYDFLQVEYSKVIVRWVKAYFLKYKEAPSIHIQDIFNSEKDSLRDEATKELIENFLLTLSKKYEKEDSFNVDYYIDRAVDYLEERSLLVTSEKVQAHVLAGKKDKAKEIMTDYRQISKSMSRWVNPFDPEYAASVYDAKFSDEKEEERTDFLFKFPGMLGDFLGPFERGWLIAFMGPLKRGKTHWLWETAIQMIMNRRNVLFITLEMPDKGLSARGYKRILARTDSEGYFAYPVFDCELNQKNTCRKRERRCAIGLLDANGNKPVYQAGMNYRPCQVCHQNGNFDYKTASWFEGVQRDRINKRVLRESVEGFSFQYGDRLRVISYPRFSANLSRITQDINELEDTEGFVADGIIIDYANILAAEDGADSSNEQATIDTTWKSLGRLAGTKHVLLATAVHSTRDTLDKQSIKASDTGRDIRIGNHVDALFSLNQTGIEKKEGVMRIGTVAHRWRPFSETDHISVLQCLDVGQTLLDSRR